MITTVVEGSILVVTAIWSVVPTVATGTPMSFSLFASNEKSKEFSSAKNFLKGTNQGCKSSAEISGRNGPARPAKILGRNGPAQLKF